MSLFECGEFRSHSGVMLPYKIDCDALSDEDIECVAKIISSKIEFGVVQCIPKGGCRIAMALEKYAVWEAPFNILIVDDVLTTGASMKKAKAEQPPQVHPNDVIGYVIFARGTLPSWVNAVFTSVV